MEVTIYPARSSCTAVERYDGDTVDLHKYAVVRDTRKRSDEWFRHQQGRRDLSGLILRFDERRLVHAGRTTRKEKPRHTNVDHLRSLGAEVRL